MARLSDTAIDIINALHTDVEGGKSRINVKDKTYTFKASKRIY